MYSGNGLHTLTVLACYVLSTLLYCCWAHSTQCFCRANLTLARVELDMYRVGPLLLVLNYNTAAFTVCSLHSFTRDQGGQMCERGNRCGLWVFQGVHQPLPPRHAAHRLPSLSERLISAHCYNRLCHTLLCVCVCVRECALNICSNMSAVVYLRHLWVKVFLLLLPLCF